MKFTTSLLAAGMAMAGLLEFAAAYNRDTMVCLVNRERGQRGLPFLGRNAALDNAAQRHSDDQARRCVMTHTGSDGSSPADRITAAGYDWKGVAENVAYGWSDEHICMKQWMESPGHRTNILTPKFTQFGSAVGYSSGGVPYYTQTFGCNGEQGPFVECPGQANAEVHVDAQAAVEALPPPPAQIPAQPVYVPAPVAPPVYAPPAIPVH
ncbi:CAP domain-containing protein [Syncephalis plumigaleata]|nr:CAP domain-containing protein [Syncephalis plumigaleata]